MCVSRGGGDDRGSNICAIIIWDIVFILTSTFDSSHISDSKLSLSTHHA